MVFSSARYPGGGDDDEGFYQDMFSTDNVGQEMSSSLGKQKISERVQEFNVLKLPSKLQFYSCQVRQPQTGGEDSPGLGSIPASLRSASSLTVYNTALCPYNTHHGPSENTKAATRKKVGGEAGAGGRGQAEEPENMSALQEGGEVVVVGQDQTGLLYFPEMGEGDLPDFDLPADLELPNIASDLQVRGSWLSAQHQQVLIFLSPV